MPFAAGIILLLALGNVIAAPLFSNQNQYLVQVSGADPYPAFTWVASALHDLGGATAWRIAAYLLTVAALWGVYLVARTLAAGEAVPLVATVLVGLTLLPVAHEYLSAFHGIAGQYLMWKPGYLQPSAFGCLLVLAVGLWLRGRLGPAAGLAVVACVLHPTYVVALAIGLAAALLADVVTGTSWRRWPGYAGTLLVAVGLAVGLNPGVAIPGSEALARFAFGRIPHHTLWTQWRLHDLLLLAVIVAGTVLVRRMHPWLAVWLTAALLPGLIAAAVVEWTRWTALALLFPWRITAVLVPVAATVIAVRLAQLLARVRLPHWRVAVLTVATAAAVWGLAGTMHQQPPAQADPAVRAVIAAQPHGTGLIPLAAENVRGNARVEVYVDWKSPPYSGEGLAAWWQRVDRVAAFERDPESICGAEWVDAIDWALLTVPPPSCMKQWRVLAAEYGYEVVQR